MDPSFSPDARTQASEAELTHCCDITYHPWPVNLRQLSGWELGGPEWSGVSGSGRVTQLKHKWNRHFTACGCFSSHEARAQMPKFCPHICICILFFFFNVESLKFHYTMAVVPHFRAHLGPGLACQHQQPCTQHTLTPDPFLIMAVPTAPRDTYIDPSLIGQSCRAV